MARLYWRVKKNGKWTWKPVQLGDRLNADQYLIVPVSEMQGEEE